MSENIKGSDLLECRRERSNRNEEGCWKKCETASNIFLPKNIQLLKWKLLIYILYKNYNSY